MTAPRLRPGLRPFVLGADEVVVAGETTHQVFADRLLPLLLPYIDGVNTLDDIVQHLDGRANGIDVAFGLSLLESAGCLASATSAIDDWTAGSGERGEREGGDQTRLEVSLRSFGHRETDLATWFAAYRVHVTAAGSLTVAVTSDYLRHDLAAFAGECELGGHQWIPIKLSGEHVWVGPVVGALESPCWSCVAARVAANQRWRSGITPSHDAGTDQREHPVDVRACHEGARRLARALRRWAHQPDALLTTILTLDHGSDEPMPHPVVSMPGCVRCASRRGPIAASPPSGRGSALWKDGGWRTCGPRDTLQRLQPLVSPVTGIVRHVRRTTPPGALPAVFEADHLFPIPAEPEELLRTGGRRRSAGKGLSEEQAQTSALCEAIERYCTVFRGDEPIVRASLDALGERALHPNRYAGFSDQQFDDRRRWNGRGWDRAWVPERFDSTRAIDWVPLQSLVDGATRHLPAACCYYGHPDAQTYGRADSNGTAAGNTLDEAVLQGLLELVERDAAALWWYNRARRPGVAVDTFGSWAADLANGCRRGGRTLTMLDITTDVGIPVFVAVSRRASADQQLVMGFGAHPDADIALARAITEVEQWMPALEAGSAGDRVSADPGEADYLTPDPTSPLRTVAAYARPADDLADAVRSTVQRVADCGVDVLVLDLTRSDVGLPVVRVAAPGLRHFWPRFGEGRLYDVPVRLRWRPTRLSEAELNGSWLLV